MISILKIQNGCNCYLVEQNGVAILIDPGLNQNADSVIKACEGKNVKMIILTHGHIDHVQSTAKVARALNAPIAMSEKDVELIEYNLNQPMNANGFFAGIVRFFSILSAKNNTIDKFEPTILLKDGQLLEESEMKLQIIALPGHTKGSIGIKVDNHFFVGDALMNMTKPGISLLYENKEDLIESAKRIEEEGNCTIYFGHGNQVQNKKWVEK